MEIAWRNNEHGFTLIEFLVAVVIISVGLLGLLQTLTYSIEHNMNTQLREEAFRLADERMATEKSRSFDMISTSTKSENIRVGVANGFKNYSVVKSGLGVTDFTKTIQVRVGWGYKGKRYSHTISSLISDTVH
jgi:type IV pilus assembly protein PilV